MDRRASRVWSMPADEDGTLVVRSRTGVEDLVHVGEVSVSLDLWAGLAHALRERGLAAGTSA